MKRILFVLFLGAISVPAYSSSIAVFAEGMFSEYTDPDGLLPFAEPAPGTIFSLEFIYDDTTPDTAFDREPDPVPEFGFYESAILSISLTIGDDTFGAGEVSNIVILNDANSGDDVQDLWLALTSTSIPTGIPDEVLVTNISLVLVTTLPTGPVPPLTSDNLLGPSWPDGWDFGQISYSISRNNLQSETSETLASATATITGITVTVVPLPAAVWLFGSALGLLGWAQRKVA